MSHDPRPDWLALVALGIATLALCAALLWLRPAAKMRQEGAGWWGRARLVR